MNEIGTQEFGGGVERAMSNTLDNMNYAASIPRLPTFEQFYGNQAGFGYSPHQLRTPFNTFDRLPNFHAYMRQNAKDFRLP